VVVVEVVHKLVYQQHQILEDQEDQEEEVLLHSHHLEDFQEDREIPHPLAHLKVIMAVVDITKVVCIMLLEEVAVQQQLEVQVEIVQVQHLQEMVEQGQLLLLQEVLLEEQVEEMVVEMFL
jgi:hypothetical protein